MRMRGAVLLWRQACLSSAHAQIAMWHCCLSIKWVDQGVVYLFDYPLSGLPLEPGVRIIEVLLYTL